MMANDDELLQIDELERFIAAASASWLLLQQQIWGVRWDYSRASLDFSRASLGTLSAWLARAARERSRPAFEEILYAAGQYFGATVQEHANAYWESDEIRAFVLRVERASGGCTVIDPGEVLSSWIEAHARGDGSENEVFVEHFDAVLAAGL